MFELKLKLGHDLLNLMLVQTYKTVNLHNTNGFLVTLYLDAHFMSTLDILLTKSNANACLLTLRIDC